MAKQFLLLSLVLFAALVASPATAVDPAGAAAAAEDASGDAIGTIGSEGAADAAPIGGPVPAGTFPDLTPAAAPTSGAAPLEVTAVAGAVAAASFVGSFFF